MLLNIDTEKNRDKVVIEKGKKVIYVVLKPALYGDLIIYLIIWLYLVGKMKPWGFQPNPYDPCIMNKLFGENVCIVCWNVDYFNISHLHSTVVICVLQLIEGKYGKVDPLTFT